MLERTRLLSLSALRLSAAGEESIFGGYAYQLAHEVTAMKDRNRKARTSSAAFQLVDPNDFWVCRVLGDCALVKVESLEKLKPARKCMRRLAARTPGSYLIFSNRSKRVLGKVVSNVAA